MPRNPWMGRLLRSLTTGLNSNKKKVAEKHLLHVSATQETERSDRRMAAQKVRFLTVRRRSPIDCVIRPLVGPPCRQCQTSSQPWARSKAPHSRHLVHSTALQNTVVFGILGVVDTPRASRPTI